MWLQVWRVKRGTSVSRNWNANAARHYRSSLMILPWVQVKRESVGASDKLLSGLTPITPNSHAQDIGRERQYARFDSPHGESGVTARRDGNTERQAIGFVEAFSDSLICPVELSEACRKSTRSVTGRPHPDRKKGVRSRQVRLISGWCCGKRRLARNR